MSSSRAHDHPRTGSTGYAGARLLGCADTDNEHQVWTDEDEGGTEYVRADLAAPHLAAVRVNVDALAQEIRRVDGNHDKGAAALAEALMPFLSALEPSPCEELMKQIRDGTAYGFLNDGSQPEGNPDLTARIAAVLVIGET